MRPLEGRRGVPGGLGIAGVIVFLLIQVLSGGGGSGGRLRRGRPVRAAAEAPGGRRRRHPGRAGSRARPEGLQRLRLHAHARTRGSGSSRRRERAFQRAKVVLYRDAVSTGCGNASSAVGPFYCPADQRVYLDLSFYGDMERQLGAPGDFAWAYVIAHEVGHHVQQQLGTSDEVTPAPARAPGRGERAVGAARAPGRLLRRRLGAQRVRRGRPREGRRGGGDRAPPPPSATTASSAGDRRQVNPDSFTHGTSEQRTALVQPRPRERRARRLRHLLARKPLAGRPGRVGPPLHAYPAVPAFRLQPGGKAAWEKLSQWQHSSGGRGRPRGRASAR